MTSNIRDYSKLSMLSYTDAIGETMVVFKSDSKTDQNHWTFDHRYEFKKEKFTGQVEAALQSGKSGGRTLKSWFSNARVNYAATANTTLYMEGNVASGGITNGEQHLFDPLYGTGHTPYGLMDLQGLRNMRHFEIGVQQKLSKTLTGLLSFNGYGLYDPEDGWYGTGGSINRRPGGQLRDATGESGRDVGKEFNLAFTWTPNKRDTLSLELGVFKPGNFVKKLIGPSTADQTWGLLSYSTKF
jgi:hypothetical protein